MQRADARRNLVALLDAAAAVFPESGVDVPAKEICDRAGLGIGTLYRHFPTRADLIVAVLQREVDQCVAAIDALSADEDQQAALTAWVDPFLHFVGTKTGLAAALHSEVRAFAGLPERLLQRIVPALETLFERGAARGSLRADVSAEDALITVALLSQRVPGRDSSFNRRMAHAFVEGLLVHEVPSHGIL